MFEQRWGETVSVEFVVSVVIAWLVIRWSVQWYFEQHGWVTIESTPPPPVFVRVMMRVRALPERLANRWMTVAPASPTLPHEQVFDADVVAEEIAPPTSEEEAGAASVIEIVEESLPEDDVSRVVTPPLTPDAAPAEEVAVAESEPMTLSTVEPADDKDGAVPVPLFLYVEAYCPTCRTQRPLVDPEETAPDEAHVGVRGICPICGGELFATLGGGE